MKRIWTPEMVDDLTQFHAEGDSATVIAQKLGDGLSRCAVIGKARRLGLPSRQSDRKGLLTGEAWRAARSPTQRPKPARGTILGHTPVRAALKPPVRPQPPFNLATYEAERRANGAVPFLDMRYHRQCKFFLQGESGCYGLVCAAPTDVTERYCEEHKAVSRASRPTFVEAAE